MQREWHIWLQLVARLLPKPFLMHIPSLAVPEAALSETGKLWAAALPPLEQQLSSPPQPFVVIVWDISVYIQRPHEGLQSRALPKSGRPKFLKHKSRSGEKNNVAWERLTIGDNVCTHCLFCEAAQHMLGCSGCIAARLQSLWLPQLTLPTQESKAELWCSLSEIYCLLCNLLPVLLAENHIWHCSSSAGCNFSESQHVGCFHFTQLPKMWGSPLKWCSGICHRHSGTREPMSLIVSTVVSQ